MAKKLLTSYTFTPGAAGAGTVVVSGSYALEQFLLITNVTDGVIIFQFNKGTKGGTISAGGGNTTLTLEADTSSMSAGDRLQVFVDDTALGTVEISNTTPIPVWDNGTSLTVDGPLTDAQLRAAAVPVSVSSLPLPSGSATEATLASIEGKTPPLQGGRVPVDIGGASVVVNGPVTVSNEVEVKNDTGNPIPAKVQNSGGALIDPATEESLEILRAMFRLLKPLGQVTGGGRNNLAVDVVNAPTVNQSGTWNINQITNSQMGGVWGFDHARALSRQAYNSGIRSRIS